MSGYYDNKYLGMLLLAALIRSEEGGIIFFDEENQECCQQKNEVQAKLILEEESILDRDPDSFLLEYRKSKDLIRSLISSDGSKLCFSEGEVASAIFQDEKRLKSIAEFSMKHQSRLLYLLISR